MIKSLKSEFSLLDNVTNKILTLKKLGSSLELDNFQSCFIICTANPFYLLSIGALTEHLLLNTLYDIFREHLHLNDIYMISYSQKSP